jgi:hypothetical protein
MKRIFLPYVTQAVLNEATTTSDELWLDDRGDEKEVADRPDTYPEDAIPDGLVVRAYCRAAAYLATLMRATLVHRYVNEAILAIPKRLVEPTTTAGATPTDVLHSMGRYGWVSVIALQELLSRVGPTHQKSGFVENQKLDTVNPDASSSNRTTVVATTATPVATAVKADPMATVDAQATPATIPTVETPATPATPNTSATMLTTVTVATTATVATSTARLTAASKTQNNTNTLVDRHLIEEECNPSSWYVAVFQVAYVGQFASSARLRAAWKRVLKHFPPLTVHSSTYIESTVGYATHIATQSQSWECRKQGTSSTPFLT